MGEIQNVGVNTKMSKKVRQITRLRLRVQAFSHKTFRVYHVYCNFILCYMCWIMVIIGTLKDGSHLIDIFASSNCFSYRNIFQNGVDALSKIDDAFLTKS